MNKKSKDSYDIFEVFRPGFREEWSFFKKLWFWLTQVFWYNYSKILLFSLCGIILVTIFICDIIFRENYDLKIVMGANIQVESEIVERLIEELKPIVGDLDDNGETQLSCQMLCTGSMYEDADAAELFDDMANAAIQKIQISFADDEVLLYFFDETLADFYAQQGAFEQLSEFGIESQHQFYIRIDDSAMFSALGVPGGDGWYGAIKVISELRQDEKSTARYDAAVRILQRLTEFKA